MTREKMEWFLEPLQRASGHPYRQIEDSIRKIMAEHVGPRRTEQVLTYGLEKLERIERYLDEIKANDLHELMRTHETRSILAVGKLMATTALFREESRNKPYHHRLDFPDTDDTNWCGLVVVSKDGDALSCSFEPITYG